MAAFHAELQPVDGVRELVEALHLHAARAMDVDPSRRAVIEDSINGAGAAIAAKTIGYGFADGLSPRDELEASGAIVFDTMDELSDILLVGGRGRSTRYR